MTTLATGQLCYEFDGKTFEKPLDGTRLRGQLQSVFDLMKDGQWRTLAEIEEKTGFPQSSISARLRDFRKEKFGSHNVARRRRPLGGILSIHEYKLVPSFAGLL